MPERLADGSVVIVQEYRLPSSQSHGDGHVEPRCLVASAELAFESVGELLVGLELAVVAAADVVSRRH